MGEPNFAKMTSMHFYGWKNGLKTGQYYLRSKPSRDAIKFTVDIEQLLSATDHGNQDEIMKCLNLDNKKIVKNDLAPSKRLDRLFSNKDYEGDLKNEEDEDDEDARNKQLDQIISSKKTEEIEEVVFECLNCGS